MKEFRVGDRVIDLHWHIGQKATIKNVSNPSIRGKIYILIQYDNKDIGWKLTELDHESGIFKNVKVGKGYYSLLSTDIKFISRPACTMREVNKAAHKENEEQAKVKAITDSYITMLNNIGG